MKLDSVVPVAHLHRNYLAILEAIPSSNRGFAIKAGIPRRALTYAFNPLREKRVRGTSISTLTRIAQAAGCSLSFLHMTPEDAELMLGKRYVPDEDLREGEPVRIATRVASTLRSAGVPKSTMVRATIVGTALESREAAFDVVSRLRDIDRA